MDDDDINATFRRAVRFIVAARRDLLLDRYPTVAERREQHDRFTVLSVWTDSGRDLPDPVVSDGLRFIWNPFHHCIESMPSPR